MKSSTGLMCCVPQGCSYPDILKYEKRLQRFLPQTASNYNSEALFVLPHCSTKPQRGIYRHYPSSLEHFKIESSNITTEIWTYTLV
jgi:hypothetical protein